MKRLYILVPVFLLLFCTARLTAQDNTHGNVVIHSDPRLLMLRKAHSAAEASSVSYIPRKNSAPAMDKQEETTSHMAVASTRNKTVGKMTSMTDVNLPVSSTVVAKSKKAEKAAPVALLNKIAGTTPSSTTKPGEKTIPKANGPITLVGGKTTHPAAWPPVHPASGPSFSARGFRVQIYNGADRKKAIEIKTGFMLHYPHIPAYLMYIAPSFRVKVGDYRRRGDAEVMLKQLKSKYTPVMIVQDVVSLKPLN